MASKKNKSDSYQYKIIEIPIDPHVLNDFSLFDGLGTQINMAKYSEKFQELRQQLFDEVIRLVNTCLTKRQAQVLALRLEGKTQIQIADELGIHQTTVHKLLMGNIDYANGKKRYGGAIKKLRKMCYRDTTVIKILGEMSELRAEDTLDFSLTEHDSDIDF